MLKSVRILSAILGAVLCVGAGYVPAASQTAELVLLHGRVATVDPQRPEAQALAIAKGRILAVGSDSEIRALVGPSTRSIDLRGQLAIPGFIESHGHFMGIGEAKMQLDLTGARSWDEIVAMVAAAARKVRPGEWILGRGWHQEKWSTKPLPAVEGFPTHHSLSKISPSNPVMLTHASGHATYANGKAMQMAGITAATPNPAGGEIVRDSSGNAIGVFRETASGLLRRAFESAQAGRSPAQVREDTRRQAELAMRECAAKGITTFHDAGVPFSVIDLYRELADERKLDLRLYVMMGESNAALKRSAGKYRVIGYGDGHLTVRAIKRMMDGALGSRGAWLLAPYRDLPGSTGLNTTAPATIAETARIALEHGLQLCVHAIGDRANRETLDIFAAAQQARPGEKDLRWRIEHAQHLNAADIPRFGALGVVAAMQGIHCTSDAPYVLARLGPERAAEGAYVWQKLMKSGALIANGTDAPVEDVDPIACFYASVSRRTRGGSVFYAEQRMSRPEALASYTLNGAVAGFEENVKGSLTAGKLADITVLSSDIMTVPEEEITKAHVVYTIVGGEIVYAEPGAPLPE